MKLLSQFLLTETITIIAFQILSSSRLGSAFRSFRLERGFAGSNRLHQQRCRIYQRSLQHLSADDTESSSSDEDLARWERMYEEGEAPTMARRGEELSPQFLMRSEVRVITFDLDNTLYLTSGCISAANDALASHLDADNIVQPKRVEKIMGELFQSNKSRYSPLDENATAPVLLTKLRTDAIRQVLEDHNDYSPDDALEYAENAFHVWTKARHDAIPNNLAPKVLACLEKVSAMKAQKTDMWNRLNRLIHT